METRKTGKVKSRANIGNGENREIRQPREKSAFFRVFRVFRGLNNFLGGNLGLKNEVDPFMDGPKFGL